VIRDARGLNAHFLPPFTDTSLTLFDTSVREISRRWNARCDSRAVREINHRIIRVQGDIEIISGRLVDQGPRTPALLLT